MTFLVAYGCWMAFFAMVAYGPPYPGGLAPWRRSKAKWVDERKGPYRLRISLTYAGGRGTTGE